MIHRSRWWLRARFGCGAVLIVLSLAGCGVPADRSQADAPTPQGAAILTPPISRTSFPIGSDHDVFATATSRADVPSSAAAAPPSMPPSAQASATPTDRSFPAPTAVPHTLARSTGDQIAYVDEGNIWLLDLATGETAPVTMDGTNSEPAWSADGACLVWTHMVDQQSDLHQLCAGATESLRYVASPAAESLFTDGNNSAAYYVRRRLGDQPEIEIVEYVDQNRGRVVHREPGGLCVPTKLDALLDQFALSLNCGRGSYSVIGTAITTTTTDLGRMIDDGLCATNAVYANHALQVAVITARECDFGDQPAITLVDLASTAAPARDVWSAAGLTSVDWSPDNTQFVAAARDGLWLIDLNGSQTPRRILDRGLSPAWRPRLPPAPAETPYTAP